MNGEQLERMFCRPPSNEQADTILPWTEVNRDTIGIIASRVGRLFTNSWLHYLRFDPGTGMIEKSFIRRPYPQSPKIAANTGNVSDPYASIHFELEDDEPGSGSPTHINIYEGNQVMIGTRTHNNLVFRYVALRYHLNEGSGDPDSTIEVEKVDIYTTIPSIPFSLN
jgi:hypothetical protein